ncbi:MAG: rhodanese-like domain-containing protein [SAR202 cluster bacterium]|nr:rhodanese-like domain-containing protein [SAR202 cluster bacterium]
MSREEVAALVKKGRAVLLDVRPAVEFQAGHIPRAISIPIDELPARVSESPPDKRVITYCRGAYCLFADEAIALLRTQAFDVARMEGGWPEWADER